MVNVITTHTSQTLPNLVKSLQIVFHLRRNAVMDQKNKNVPKRNRYSYPCG